MATRADECRFTELYGRFSLDPDSLAPRESGELHSLMLADSLRSYREAMAAGGIEGRPAPTGESVARRMALAADFFRRARGRNAAYAEARRHVEAAARAAEGVGDTLLAGALRGAYRLRTRGHRGGAGAAAEADRVVALLCERGAPLAED